MNKPQTTERLLAEVFITLLLFASIGWMVHQLLRASPTDALPSVEDLHQQQEMIDYHRTEGRTIIINR